MSDARKKYKGLMERRVEVANPDGTTTVHTFFTDSHDCPARVAEPPEPGTHFSLMDFSAWDTP
jgi:hypothetical protein